jgi:hypothetical protein
MGSITAVGHKNVLWSTLEGCIVSLSPRVLVFGNHSIGQQLVSQRLLAW